MKQKQQLIQEIAKKEFRKLRNYKTETNQKAINNPEQQIQTIYTKLKQNFQKDKLLNDHQIIHCEQIKMFQNHQAISQKLIRLPKIHKNKRTGGAFSFIKQQIQKKQILNKEIQKSLKEINQINLVQKQQFLNNIIKQYLKSSSLNKSKNDSDLTHNNTEILCSSKIKSKKYFIKDKMHIRKFKEDRKLLLQKTFQISNPNQLQLQIEEPMVCQFKKISNLYSVPPPPDNKSLNKIQTQKSITKIMRRNIITCKDLKFQFQIFAVCQFNNLMKAYNNFEVGMNNQGNYKAFIQNGNNGALIKKCLKARGYWQLTDCITQDVNFIWSQKKNKIYQKFQNRNITNQTSPSKNFGQRKKSNLLKQFLQNRKNDYPFLEVIEPLLSKQNFEGFINQIILNYIENPKKSFHNAKISSFLSEKRIKQKKLILQNPHSLKLHNHISLASSIGNKKDLFHNMKTYCNYYNKKLFQVIPHTVHIFSKNFDLDKYRTQINFPCLLKPGEITNRGKGISIHFSENSLIQTIKNHQRHSNGTQRTHIIQKYIFPFLYNNRKIDIRVWVLWNGKQAWWYKQGYIRTSSKEFNIKSGDKYVHLTNDAIQKNSQDYGKFEAGNKLSFSEFQKYLEINQINHNFLEQAYPEMKKIALDVFKIGNFTMDRQNKLFGYELFGLDFMIDQNFKVWLIEVNTNPCLEISCPLLNRLIPNMLENVLCICLDPLFPPPISFIKKQSNKLQNFRFELLYDGYQQSELSFITDQFPFQMQQKQYLQNQST